MNSLAVHEGLGMKVDMSREKTAIFVKSALMKEGGSMERERGFKRDRRRKAMKVQLAFCSKISAWSPTLHCGRELPSRPQLHHGNQ